MADISKTVSIIFLGEDKASATLGRIEAGITGVGGSSTEATDKVGSLESALGGLGDQEGSILTLVNGLKLLAGALVVREFIDANVELERFDRAMTQITGSSDLAAKEFEYIKGVANTLGLEVNSVASSYIGWSAATKRTALEGEQAKEVFEAVSVAMAKLGKSSADTEGVLNALGQMVSKGTVSMEELRQQLGDRLYGAFVLAADGMGITTAELNELVASGNLASTEFLPRFAEEIRKTYGQTEYIEGFIAANNRLSNSMTELYQTVASETGLFELLASGANALAGAIREAATTLVQLKNGEFENVLEKRLRELSELGKESDAFWEASAQRAIDAKNGIAANTEETRALRDQFNALEKQAYTTGDAIKEGMDKGKLSAEDLAKAGKEVDAALKALGIDPKQFKDPLDEVLAALDKLANNPAVTGDQFLSGFLVTLDKIKSGPEGLKDIERVVVALAKAQEAGVLTTEQYTAALQALEVKNSGAWEGMIRTADAGTKNADALKKQADEARKAEEETRKYALELEKLASNERIKLIEARVQLNVAELEADTRRIESAFGSVNTGIESTGKLLESLFGDYADASQSGSWAAESAIRKQIELENERRDQEFELQKELVEAQIANMRARTDAMNRGDGLIQIDGAGLQPHLEAFMWEILRTIQTRVNDDGLEMLLGLNA